MAFQAQDALSKANELFRSGLWDSVTLLCDMYALGASAEVRTHFLVLGAEASTRLGDSADAIERLRAAMDIRKAGATPRTMPVPVEGDDELPLRYAEACARTGNWTAVAQALRAIPTRGRSVATHNLLGMAHQRTGDVEGAITELKAVVRRNAFAIASLVALAKLGVPMRTIATLIPTGALPPTLLDFVAAHTLLATGFNYRDAAKQFARVEDALPSFPAAPLLRAEALTRAGRLHDAHQAFLHAMRTRLSSISDPLVPSPTAMDLFASCLVSLNRLSDLRTLADNLMAHKPTAPETWFVMAHRLTTEDQAEEALACVKKGLVLNEKSRDGQMLLSELLLGMGQKTLANTTAKLAHSLHKDYYSFRMVVTTSIACEHYRLALATAKEARTALPRDARALVLVGVVCALSDDGTDKARQIFSQVVSIDPECSEAVSHLAEMYRRQKKFTEAIQTLEKYIERNCTAEFLVQLGSTYALNRQRLLAEENFNAALKIDAKYRPALEGLKALETFFSEEENNPNE